MFQQHNKHHSFSVRPSPSSHVRVDPVMELVVNFLETSIFNELTNLLPVIFVNLLLLDHDFFLMVGIRSFGCLFFIEIKPGLINLQTSFISGAGERKVQEVDLACLLRQFCKIDLFSFLGGSLLVEFLHELKIFLSAVLDGLLHFDHLGLFLQRMRGVSLKLQVAEYAAGGWILGSQSMGADELIQIVQSSRNVIPDLYDRSFLTS